MGEARRRAEYKKTHPTPGVADLNYDDDAGDRIMRIIEHLPTSNLLEPAARTAGTQLEMIKPALMGAGPDGAFFGSAAHVELGTVMIILADSKRVVSFGFAPGAGYSSSEAIQNMCLSVENHPDWSPRFNIVDAILVLLDEYGSEPNYAAKGTSMCMGVPFLFAALSRANSESLGKALDGLRESAVCPVLVGLIGPSSSGREGHYSASWPLLLPLAPYAEYVMRRVDGHSSDA